MEPGRQFSAEPHEKDAVLNVFASLFRPLTQVACEYSVSAREITDVLRRVYLQGLEARLSAQMRPTSDARLALIAGLNRSEVASVRRNGKFSPNGDTPAAATADQVSSILTAWHTQTRFSGAYGLALDLDLTPVPDSPRASFQELVESTCQGLDWEAVLDELVASGSIEIIDAKVARCRSRAYVLPSGDVSVIERAARFLEAAASSFAHNILQRGGPTYFERTVVSDFALTEKGRDEFLKWSSKSGQEFLTELDTTLAKIAETMSSANGRRYGVGVYFFEDESQAPVPVPEKSDSTVERQPSRPRVIEEIDVLAPTQPKK